MKRLFVLVIVVAFSFLATTVLTNQFQASKESTQEGSLVAQTNAAVKGVADKVFGIPVEVSIPSLEVKAEVESVGLADDGRMDVPTNYENVAWWQYGSKPGETGSAVLAGHFDTPVGEPGVFYDLKKLKPGDSIEVKDKDGEIKTFEVVKTESFEDANFPIDEVFSKGDGQWLNLITCDGVFDQESNNYSNRFVVFSKLKE